MTPEQLTALLHRHIPLTATMQVQVRHSEAERVVIAAPLAPNINVHGTAFGGSLAILGILSGWTLLHATMQRHGLAAKLVIQKHECEFLEPVAAEFSAESRLPEAEAEAFLQTLRKGRRARISLRSTIHAGAGTAVESRATFVAVP